MTVINSNKISLIFSGTCSEIPEKKNFEQDYPTSRKEMLIDSLKKNIADKFDIPVENLNYGLPPSGESGDFSLSFFDIARNKNTSPITLAEEIALFLRSLPEVTSAVSVKGYVNFRISDTVLTELVDNCLNGKVFSIEIGQGEKIMVEFFSPNTNKPLHVGHLRNLFIGDALCRLLDYTGFRAIRVNLYNDRGIHICKAHLAYKKWGNNLLPQDICKKGDHFVGEYYVMFHTNLKNNPELDSEAQLLLQRWENNDDEVIREWKKIRDWVAEGFNETLKRVAIRNFDINYWESEFWKEGVSVVHEGIQKGIFKEGDSGSVIADLEGVGIKPLLRTDGTALYITQDIYLAEKKFREYPDLFKSIYVVAAEQTEHFLALFRILEMMGREWYNRCYHLSYGMILIKGGKLKSREGVTADADTMIEDLENLALTELLKRNPLLDLNILKFRASKIAVSALKWEFLKVNALSNLNFDPESSLKLKGNTGPYILYTFARISSLKRKAAGKEIISGNMDIAPPEREIISLLYFYPYVIADSVKSYNFSNICSYLYQLAVKFNAYFQVNRIINNDTVSGFRLDLASAVRMILKEGLQILGIETLEEM